MPNADRVESTLLGVLLLFKRQAKENHFLEEELEKAVLNSSENL